MSTLSLAETNHERQLDQPVKTVSILGSTGSIGRSTIKLIKAHPELYRVSVLTANNNVEELIKQAVELRPDWVVIGNKEKFYHLKSALEGTGMLLACGYDAIIEAAAFPSDIVLEGIVGAAGLAPTFAAIRRGATVAIANKEPLVCAGDLIRQEAFKYGAQILPVDSEHNAIFQVFDFEKPETVDKIILTSSGGPFRQMSLEDMRHVSAAEAIKHPNWSMGAKISVDSATMMNKALEVIEAYQLFPVKAEQIDVVVHPQSIVHSMVEYQDGSVLAQMGPSDMTLPIAYALAWPQRIRTPIKKLNLVDIGELTFEKPDYKRFPALRLAHEVLDIRGIYPIVFNAANEVAVAHFLEGKIGFLEIVPIIEATLAKITGEHFTNNTLEDILAVDEWARRMALKVIELYGNRG
jgi:1-deoxy-D-xylulose-5-phosphate reductoisomerase